ncbi:hypothetical protein ACI2I2_13700 [Scandinavium sp. NPDC088450]|uniref:hypothetical protein n=1 Tax=Scandinavium sp. NPDC088450 TaxID=3364514 RepID=UPI00384C5FD6
MADARKKRKQKIKKGSGAELIMMMNTSRGRTNKKHLIKNKENQFIDFRLIITKKEKPRFFLLCLPI